MTDCTTRVPPEDVLAQVEPFFFLDYAMFGGMVRQYASRTLEDALPADSGPTQRGLHLVNLLMLEYQALGDAAVFLGAFLRLQTGKEVLPLSLLVRSTDEDTVLTGVFARAGVTTPEELYSALPFDKWIPTDWSEWYGDLDLKKALQLACRFFLEDCCRNQKVNGVRGYQGLLRGPLVVPSGRRYLSALPDAPAVLIRSDNSDPTETGKQFTLYGFRSDDDMEQRHRSIEFIQCNLRLMSALYTIGRYPEALPVWGFESTRAVFDSPDFLDVMHLVREVSTTGEAERRP